MDWEPCYLALHRSGELGDRARQARERMSQCDLCGWACQVDRSRELGQCETGMNAVVASYGPHMGEEQALRGWQGSGTIFFSWCNMGCRFCQNAEISQQGSGEEVDAQRLATIMIALQASGCHNINFVSPSHVVAPILEAVDIAAGRGLKLPLVYNTGGYDSLTALALLDGVIDIYMPDIKYADDPLAKKFSQIRDYPAVNRAAVREMHRQVGELNLDERGVARRGLLVRHLVLPGGMAGTSRVAKFLADQVSRDTYLNVMGQYRPCHQASRHPPLDRPVSAEELAQARLQAREAGLRRVEDEES